MTRERIQNGSWTRINIGKSTLLFPTEMKEDILKQLERNGVLCLSELRGERPSLMNDQTANPQELKKDQTANPQENS